MTSARDVLAGLWRVGARTVSRRARIVSSTRGHSSLCRQLPSVPSFCRCGVERYAPLAACTYMSKLPSLTAPSSSCSPDFLRLRLVRCSQSVAAQAADKQGLILDIIAAGYCSSTRNRTCRWVLVGGAGCAREAGGRTCAGLA